MIGISAGSCLQNVIFDVLQDGAESELIELSTVQPSLTTTITTTITTTTNTTNTTNSVATTILWSIKESLFGPLIVIYHILCLTETLLF